jgi:hypothetical protein
MKSIKKLILLFVCTLFAFSISSCDSFFEPLPEKQPITEEIEETNQTVKNPDNFVFAESILTENNNANDEVAPPTVEEETTEQPEIEELPSEDVKTEEEIEPNLPNDGIIDTPTVEENEPETETEEPNEGEVEEDTSVNDTPTFEDTETDDKEEIPSEEVEEETTEEKEEVLPENTDKPLEEIEKEEVVETPSNEENNHPTSDGYYISEALVFTSGVHVLKDLIIICDNDDRAAVYAEGAGTIIIIESGVYYGGTNGSSAPAVYARDGATIIINGGSFYTGEGNATVYAKNYAYVEINGGSFMALAPWQNHYYVLNLADNTDSKILVKGGVFRKFDPSNNYSENPAVNFVADGYRVVPVVKENGDIWYKVEILKK